MNEEKEKILKDLVKIASDGYADNAELGRAGLIKTRKLMEEITDDEQLIRTAILRSPYAKDPDFDGLTGTMVLF